MVKKKNEEWDKDDDHSPNQEINTQFNKQVNVSNLDSPRLESYLNSGNNSININSNQQ